MQTNNLLDLPTLSAYYYDTYKDFDFDQDEINIPVSHDGYSFILHLPNCKDVSLSVSQINDIIDTGDFLFYVPTAATVSTNDEDDYGIGSEPVEDPDENPDTLDSFTYTVTFKLQK